MSRMVSDMLFLAQVSHPASMVEFGSVSLIDETQRVCDLFSISAEEGEIQPRSQEVETWCMVIR